MHGNRPHDYRVTRRQRDSTDDKEASGRAPLDKTTDIQSEEPMNPRDAALNREAQQREEIDQQEGAQQGREERGTEEHE